MTVKKLLYSDRHSIVEVFVTEFLENIKTMHPNGVEH